MAEIPAQKSIKPLAPELLLQASQQQRSLLVRHRGHAIVGVAALQVDQKNLVPLRELGHLPLQLLAAEHGFHFFARPAVYSFLNPPLHVHRESLVEPEVAPGGVGDQVARPGMRQLVRHQRDQALVAGQDGRGGEGQSRILHPAVRETGRQHQQVVAAPSIGSVQLLRRFQHLLGVCKLLRRAVDHAGLRVHAGAAAHRAEFEIADRQRDQVGRNRHALPERVFAAAGRIGIVRRRHHGPQVLRRPHARRIRNPHPWRILQRDPASRMDSLGLREQKGALLAGRLWGIKPLQRGCIGAGRIPDANLCRRGRHRDGQRRAQDRIVCAQRELGVGEGTVPRGDFHFLDAQIARIQNQRGRPAVHLPLHLERSRALQDFLLEQDVAVEVKLLNPDLLRVRERVNIASGVPHSRPVARGREEAKTGRGRDGNSFHLNTPSG